MDTSVLTTQPSRQLQPRSPSDWDIDDPDKPGSFLPIWEFTFTADDPGESTVVFEIPSDGDRIELCQVTVVVEE